LRQPETVSVCSCTCYGGSSNNKRKRKGGARGGGKKSKNQEVNRKTWWQKSLNFLSKQRAGFQNADMDSADDHYYDAETQSISNGKKFAIKRNSF
jgi:hypothetical protein